MDKETKIFLASIGVALIILWIAKPKSASKKTDVKAEEFKSFDASENKYKEPKVMNDDSKKLQENAVISLKAMRSAIDAKEPKKELDKLNAMVNKDYGIKLMMNKSNGLLRALSKAGKVIAEEEANKSTNK
jgi:hypothetical protein